MAWTQPTAVFFLTICEPSNADDALGVHLAGRRAENGCAALRDNARRSPLRVAIGLGVYLPRLARFCHSLAMGRPWCLPRLLIAGFFIRLINSQLARRLTGF